MKTKLLKKIRKRYKIVQSIAKHGHEDRYFNAIDIKKKWKSEDCMTLSEVEDKLIKRIIEDYPNALTRNRAVDVWF